MLHLALDIDGETIEIKADISLVNALNLASGWGASLKESMRAQAEVDALTNRGRVSLARLKAAIVADSTTT